MKSHWFPNHNLAFQLQTHQLLQTVTLSEINNLQQICQGTQNTAIIRHTHDHSINISIKDIQNLISHGKVTFDNTMLIYINMISETYDIPHLYTDFIPRLQNKGWGNVIRYFSNPSRNSRRRSLTRPDITGEPAIIIPTHIYESHWIAIVRREIKNQVLFLYADDMNNATSEQTLKQLITTQTDHRFCPPSAKWIKCNNTFYTPHSNECGPRALLALHIMATHPNPDDNILIHLMHPNLAQISRVWIAVYIVTGKLHDTNILYPMSTTNNPVFSYTARSIPSDVIQWPKRLDPMHEQTRSTPTSSQSVTSKTPSSSAASYLSASSPVDLETRSLTSSSPSQEPINRQRIPYDQEVSPEATQYSVTPFTQDRLYIPPTSNSIDIPTTALDDTPTPSSQSLLKQETITKWTVNRGAHLLQDEASFLKPFGHDLPIVDTTTTLRVVMQNPQYAMQLTRDNNELLQVINNLTTLQASVFAAISPNVNFCNISNMIKFKSSFKRSFKQVHLAASSSNIGSQAIHRCHDTLTGGTAIITFDH
jgi:hypothetical protein